jgi:AbrB family looped-hinge helix DNA binding protein
VNSLENVVKVTRRGQTTIPQKIRQQCGVKEGDRLLVEATDKGILFKHIPNLLDLVGIDMGVATPEQLNKMISINLEKNINVKEVFDTRFLREYISKCTCSTF